MARGLAIETSGRVGSVAIVRDGHVLVEEAFEHGFKHATELLPMVDRLVRAQGWQPADVEELYVSVGPGSFTGLRIGVTLAKTMALATGVKVVAVPTVRVLADNAPPDAPNVIVVLDAKRDQIFTARFARAGNRWETQEDAHLDSLADMLHRSPRPVWLIGEGIPLHEKFLPKDDADVIVTPPDAWRARATAVATLGTEMAALGQYADVDKLTPIYIRRPEAEEKWDQAHKQ